MIKSGFCIDLETTISSKIPDNIRPPGQKRFETRIIEIGAVDWKHPSTRWGCLVNPLPKNVTLKTPTDLFSLLRSMHQNPDATLNFWSTVLVKRKALTSSMFLHSEHPQVWINRTNVNRAKDFIRWYNNPSIGPSFLSESVALEKLINFTAPNPVWLAHNGRSFDFKVLQGCALRCRQEIPSNIQQIDTLHAFRKMLPGHKSYSQPILYKNIFHRSYNAHVAIDDAVALAELCNYASTTKIKATTKIKTTSTVVNKVKMDLFMAKTPTAKTSVTPTVNKMVVNPTATVRQLRGIGPKTAAALAAENITTVNQLKQKFDVSGIQWLRGVLPSGVRWRVVARSISLL